jgi:dTDP-4-dehydrorhamnose 3,5-epimerase
VEAQVKFYQTLISGMYIVNEEPRFDERGAFTRVFCADEILQATRSWSRIRQINESHNDRRHTLRGMHWQAAPGEETKIVRVNRGTIYDVVVDVRPDSPTYLRWFGFTLVAGLRQQLIVPPNCAHGFLTLEDNTDVLYTLTNTYDPASERGFNYDDPKINIKWPAPPQVISKRDRDLPFFGVELTR